MSQTSVLPVVTDATFAAETAPGSGLVAVEISAEWCGPCKILGPIVESLAAEYAPKMRVLQMDNDANPAMIARLGVRSIPTILVFRDGDLVDRIVGAVPKATLRERFDRLAR